jgi:hypothetical protein
MDSRWHTPPAQRTGHFIRPCTQYRVANESGTCGRHWEWKSSSGLRYGDAIGQQIGGDDMDSMPWITVTCVTKSRNPSTISLRPARSPGRSSGTSSSLSASTPRWSAVIPSSYGGLPGERDGATTRDEVLTPSSRSSPGSYGRRGTRGASAELPT